VPRASSGGHPERTIQHRGYALVDLTHNLGLATTGPQFGASGPSQLLFGQPGVYAPGLSPEVARLLDNSEPWLNEAAPNEPLSVYIGKGKTLSRSAGASLITPLPQPVFRPQLHRRTLGPTRQLLDK